MKQINLSSAFAKGWEGFTRHPLRFLAAIWLIGLTRLLFYGPITVLTYITDIDKDILEAVIIPASILTIIIQVVFFVGFTRMSLASLRDEPVKLTSLFWGFKKLGRIIVGTMLAFIFLAIPSLLLLLLLGISSKLLFTEISTDQSTAILNIIAVLAGSFTVAASMMIFPQLVESEKRMGDVVKDTFALFRHNFIYLYPLGFLPLLANRLPDIIYKLTDSFFFFLLLSIGYYLIIPALLCVIFAVYIQIFDKDKLEDLPE